MKPSRGFWVTGFVLAMTMVSANIPSTLYGVYAARWDFGPATITAIFAVYVLFLIPALLVGGQWSDHQGRKPVIYVALGFAMLGTLVFFGAENVTELFLARSFQGIAGGLLSGVATAQLTELDKRGTRAPLVASLATGGGTAVGPLFGGILAQYGPWPLRLAYGVAFLGLALGSVAFVRASETRPATAGRFHWMRPRIPSSIRKTFWLAGGGAFVVWSVTAFFMVLAPSYVTTLLHVNNLAVAGGVVFLMLATASVAQLLLRGVAPHRAMPIGLVLILVALLGLLVAIPSHALWLVVISTIIAGIGQGSTFLASMTTVARIAPPADKAQVVSSFYVVIYCGVGAPVLGMGLVAQRIGLYRAMLFYSGFVAMLTLCVIGGLWRQRRMIETAI